MRHWYPILGRQGAKRVRPDTPFWATSESRVTPKWGAGYAANGGRNQHTVREAVAQSGPQPRTAEIVAKEHGIGKNTVKHAAKFSKGVDVAEKVQKIKFPK